MAKRNTIIVPYVAATSENLAQILVLDELTVLTWHQRDYRKSRIMVRSSPRTRTLS